MYGLCLPVLILFLIILPLVIFVILFRSRNKLQLITTKLSLGFFTLGYNDER